MTQKFAISEYPNVDEIHAKLEAPISQPLRPVCREQMTEYLNDWRLAHARVHGGYG